MDTRGSNSSNFELKMKKFLVCFGVPKRTRQVDSEIHQDLLINEEKQNGSSTTKSTERHLEDNGIDRQHSSTRNETTPSKPLPLNTPVSFPTTVTNDSYLEANDTPRTIRELKRFASDPARHGTLPPLNHPPRSFSTIGKRKLPPLNINLIGEPCNNNPNLIQYPDTSDED